MEYYTPLKSYSKRRIKSDQDVEEVLQNIFIKIYQNSNTLKDEKKIKAWIYTIAKNEICDFYRVKRHQIDQTNLTQELCEMQEDNTYNNEIAKCLSSMIQYLPEKYKQSILLTKFQNLTQKQLANHEGISLAGAKSRVQRAQGLLKAMVLDCCELETDCRGNIIDYKIKNGECKYCK